ncbi:MAG TPA: hypothetical protein VLG92_00485 [Candidatus Saccharimonadia bacterium]|nr:hypothetical protein [Candidatus Saccharimonadia bacterium]
MRRLHKTLHLQHHSHTGRLLHHKHTSYRGLAVVFVLAGFFIIGLNSIARATADSLYVYARIAAPVPTSPPVITSPTDGTKTDKATVTVSGTCPVVTPQVVIVLLDNGNEVGSTPCDSSNDFKIAITLQPGNNILVARPYTITGDTGPDSNAVAVLYTPPLPPATPATSIVSSTPATTTQSNAPPLVLTTDLPFITFGPEKDAVWLGSISGGAPPYTLAIDWGDGTVETYQINQPGQQSYQHHYRTMQPYDITIQVRDTSGQVVTRHYAAITPYLPPIAVGLFSTPPNSPPIWSGPKLFGIYGVYLAALAGFGWLWLHASAPAYAHAHIHSARHKTIHSKRKR